MSVTFPNWLLPDKETYWEYSIDCHYADNYIIIFVCIQLIATFIFSSHYANTEVNLVLFAVIDLLKH